MKKSRTVFALYTIIFVAFLFIPLFVWAQESPSYNKKWREAFVTVDRQAMPVEAMEGTTLGVMEQRGFAFFQDGEVATVTAWFTFEGSGPKCEYKGYLLYSFKDGSTQVASFDGHGNPVGKQQGTFTFLKGTGRFEGIEGSGTFKAEGFPPKADLYVDAEAKYTILKN